MIDTIFGLSIDDSTPTKEINIVQKPKVTITLDDKEDACFKPFIPSLPLVLKDIPTPASFLNKSYDSTDLVKQSKEPETTKKGFEINK